MHFTNHSTAHRIYHRLRNTEHPVHSLRRARGLGTCVSGCDTAVAGLQQASCAVVAVAGGSGEFGVEFWGEWELMAVSMGNERWRLGIQVMHFDGKLVCACYCCILLLPP